MKVKGGFARPACFTLVALSLSHVRWTWRGEIGVSEGGSGAIGRAERLRCHHLAPLLALKAEKIKVMIKMTEKKKLHPKEPLSGPGGEGAGQKRSGGSGRASSWGPGPSGEGGSAQGNGQGPSSSIEGSAAPTAPQVSQGDPWWTTSGGDPWMGSDDRRHGGGGHDKIQVPEYSGEDDRDGLKAKGYIRKVEAWRRVTRLSRGKQALMLYNSLAGR